MSAQRRGYDRQSYDRDDNNENEASIKFRPHDSDSSSSINLIQSILVGSLNLESELTDMFMQAVDDDSQHGIVAGNYYKCVGFPPIDNDALSVYIVDPENDVFDNQVIVKLQLFISHVR